MNNSSIVNFHNSSFIPPTSDFIFLASVAGLEPATSAFVAQHSDFQLSYTEEGEERMGAER
jgi:hypothetical protein